jgi:hypothetical protein
MPVCECLRTRYAPVSSNTEELERLLASSLLEVAEGLSLCEVHMSTDKIRFESRRSPHHLQVKREVQLKCDDRRDLLDHRRTVRWRRRDRSNRRHWRGVRVGLVRAAAASPPRLVSSRGCLIGKLRTSEHPSTRFGE